MSRFWSKLTGRLTPYVPGEQPGRGDIVKLNTNENPYPPSPKVAAAIRAVDEDALRRYPDPQSSRLRSVIADHFGLDARQVFVGNGSDEVLAFAFMGLLKQDAPLYFPDISYSFYPVWCDLCDIRYETAPLADDFAIDPESFPADCGGIILPNPNAPTGRLMPLESIRRLLSAHPDRVVVIDEAYVDFGGSSAACLVPEYENLLVVQTLSKSRSLAGMRVGYALGQEPLVEALDRVKNSFNSYPLDALAQAGAAAAFEDDAYFRATCARVIASRERLAAELAGLGFAVVPSSANFLFVTHPDRDAAHLQEALRERGVLVRHFARPGIDAYLRISIGTDADCDRLLECLRELLVA